jgi:hypothetical protein
MIIVEILKTHFDPRRHPNHGTAQIAVPAAARAPARRPRQRHRHKARVYERGVARGEIGMMVVPAGVRVLVATQPVDFRIVPTAVEVPSAAPASLVSPGWPG